MNRKKTILWSAWIGAATGAALGAGMMYLLDPDRGRRRRALAREKSGSVIRHATRTVSKMARDLRNRTQGFAAEARPHHEPVADDVLVGRVRARLGRLVGHPHQVDVTVRDGVVTLGGIVARNEFERVIMEIRRVAGVKKCVANRLSETVATR